MKLLLSLMVTLPTIAMSQNFAVRLAGDTANPASLPTNWPVQVQPVGKATELPKEFQGWRLMTLKELEDIKTAVSAAKEAWNAAKEAEAEQPKRDRETVIKQAIADLKGLRDSTGTLTAAQLSNAARLIARAILFLLEDAF